MGLVGVVIRAQRSAEHVNVGVIWIALFIYRTQSFVVLLCYVDDVVTAAYLESCT